jgi:hypothetical protein
MHTRVVKEDCETLCIRTRRSPSVPLTFCATRRGNVCWKYKCLRAGPAKGRPIRTIFHLVPDQVLTHGSGYLEDATVRNAKDHSRWEHVLKNVHVHEWIAVLASVGVKVIVREVTGGEEHLCNPRKAREITDRGGAGANGRKS